MEIPPRGVKNARHLNIFRIHQLNQIFHDDIHAIFMKIAMITETKQIQLQALALHPFSHQAGRRYGFPQIGLSCNRTQTGKFGTVKTYPIVVSGMFVHKGLQHFGSIILPVLGLRPEKGQFIFLSIKICFFIFMFSLSYLGIEILSLPSTSFH